MSTTSYDETGYASSSFPQTHPVKLSTIARLFGMNPPDPANCRVLELGAADGANLLPLAQAYPNSTFVGLDLSIRQVDEGKAIIAGAGLKNVTLEHKNILEFDRQGMVFDYIICHGVFSWVPDVVKERILSLCKEALSPQGVAYISYNALPGWHMRGMMRDMMIYHTKAFPDEKSKTSQARALIKFLAESVPTENNPYGQFLRSELGLMANWNDTYLYHEFLEDDNRAYYFHEFSEAARKHDLQYLGEPELSAILATNFDPKIQQTLYKIAGNIIGMEQYMDFLRNRTFRMSLLVHQELTLTRTINPLLLREMWFATAARPVNEKVNLTAGVREHFTIAKHTVNSDSTLVKGVLVALFEASPRQLTFTELMEAVRAKLNVGSTGVRLKAEIDQEEVVVCDQLLILFSRGMLEAVAHPFPTISATLPEKPLAPALVRYQALNYPRHVTNLRHQAIKLDVFARHALSLMDGTRDVNAIVRGMAEKAVAGAFTVQNHGQTITDVDEIAKLIHARVATCIAQFPKLSVIEKS